jgi:glycine cleavage system H lipoate-binding protein
VNKTEEFAEKSLEISKDLKKKAEHAADVTYTKAKEVGSITAKKTKEVANVTLDTGSDVFLKTGKVAESVVKPVAGTVVHATEQVGEQYEKAKDHLYDFVKDARDKAALKKEQADAKRHALHEQHNKDKIEKEIENINDIQRY